MFLFCFMVKALLFCLCLCGSPGHWWSVTPPSEGALAEVTSYDLPPPLSPGQNPEAWARNLKHEDFQLLCLDGSRKPVTEARSCHLAIVPSHAVVSRKDWAEFVRRMLFNQQVWGFSPHPPHECSAHLQSCTDTPQPSCTLFLPGQWSLPLMEVGGWWLCSLLALGLSRVSQWKSPDIWAFQVSP